MTWTAELSRRAAVSSLWRDHEIGLLLAQRLCCRPSTAIGRQRGMPLGSVDWPLNVLTSAAVFCSNIAIHYRLQEITILFNSTYSADAELVTSLCTSDSL